MVLQSLARAVNNILIQPSLPSPEPNCVIRRIARSALREQHARTGRCESTILSAGQEPCLDGLDGSLILTLTQNRAEGHGNLTLTFNVGIPWSQAVRGVHVAAEGLESELGSLELAHDPASVIDGLQTSVKLEGPENVLAGIPKMGRNAS